MANDTIIRDGNHVPVLAGVTDDANEEVRMIPVDPSTGAILVEADGDVGIGGITWNEVTGTSATMAVNNGYIANNAGLVTLTLPDTAAVGDTIQVVGKGAGLWRIAQNAGESIRFAGAVTATGTGGYIEALNVDDCVELVCTTANTVWKVASQVGAGLTMNV